MYTLYIYIYIYISEKKFFLSKILLLFASYNSFLLFFCLHSIFSPFLRLLFLYFLITSGFYPRLSMILLRCLFFFFQFLSSLCFFIFVIRGFPLFYFYFYSNLWFFFPSILYNVVLNLFLLYIIIILFPTFLTRFLFWNQQFSLYLIGNWIILLSIFMGYFLFCL